MWTESFQFRINHSKKTTKRKDTTLESISGSRCDTKLSVYTGSWPVVEQQPAAMNCATQELHPLTELSLSFLVERPPESPHSVTLPTAFTLWGSSCLPWWRKSDSARLETVNVTGEKSAFSRRSAVQARKLRSIGGAVTWCALGQSAPTWSQHRQQNVTKRCEWESGLKCGVNSTYFIKKIKKCIGLFLLFSLFTQATCVHLCAPKLQYRITILIDDAENKMKIHWCQQGKLTEQEKRRKLTIANTY